MASGAEIGDGRFEKGDIDGGSFVSKALMKALHAKSGRPSLPEATELKLESIYITTYDQVKSMLVNNLDVVGQQSRTILEKFEEILNVK